MAAAAAAGPAGSSRGRATQQRRPAQAVDTELLGAVIGARPNMNRPVGPAEQRRWEAATKAALDARIVQLHSELKCACPVHLILRPPQE